MDEKFSTPGLLKIKKLTEKLVNLQLGMEHEKESRKDMNMFKISNLEEKVNKIKSTEEIKFSFKDSLIKLQEQISKERESREIFDERKSKEVKLLENNLAIDINIEKQSGKDAFFRLNKAVEEKLFEVKIELGKEKAVREESEDKRIQEFTNEISLLQESVENETQTREQGYDRLLKKIKEDMGKMYELVELQAKMREEAHKMYTTTVDDMDQRVRQEILRERKEREITEETLIRLLEETCNRVEVGLSHNLYKNRSKAITIIPNMYPIPKEAYSYWPDGKNCLIETKDYVERLIFARQSFRDWELSALEDLDRILSNDIEMENDEKLRFLYGSGWNLKATTKAIKDYVKWQKETPPGKLVYPLVAPVLNSGGVYIHGRDHRYRPLLVIQPAKLAGFNFQILLMASCFLLEYIKENMLIPGQVENWVLIIDLQAFEPKDLCSKLINDLQSLYPCRIGKIFIISSQKTLPLLKLLSLNTLHKISVIESVCALLQTCNPSQIEEKFGGTANNLKTFWPPVFPSQRYKAESDPPEGFLSGYSSYDEYFCLNYKNSDMSILKVEDKESFISNSEFKDEIWQKLDVVSGSFSFLHTDLCTRPPELEEFHLKGRGRGEDVTGTSSNMIVKRVDMEQELFESGCCVDKSCVVQ